MGTPTPNRFYAMHSDYRRMTHERMLEEIMNIAANSM